MTLVGIPSDIQNLLILDYENRVKTILFVGFFIIALVYKYYWSKQQKPTKLFLVGTFRATMYIMSWMYSWLFWLIYPIYLHPNVPLDNLLLFMAWSYTGLFTLFFVILMFNFTVWLPIYIVKFGNIDVRTWEDGAFAEYFGSNGIGKWLKK